MITPTGVLLLGIAAVVGAICLVQYLRTCARRQKEFLSYLRPGLYVAALIHYSSLTPDAANLKSSVEGEVKTVHDDGTMTVRCFESGKIYRCNQTGYFPIAAEDERVMRQLREEDDFLKKNRAIGESPSGSVH